MSDYKHGVALMTPEEIAEFESKCVRGVATPEALAEFSREQRKSELQIRFDVGAYIKYYTEQEEMARVRNQGLRFIG